MRIMLRGRHAAVVVTLALLVAPSTGMAQAPPPDTQHPNMFGFDLGEERRYVFEGEGLLPGEIRDWLIRFESITPGPGGAVAHFHLEYEEKNFVRRHTFSSSSEMRQLKTITDLWVNEHGFPLRIDHVADDPDELPRRDRIKMEFVDGVFEVDAELAFGVRRYKLHIPNRSFVDLDVPRGVFVDHSLNPGLLSLPFATLVGPASEAAEYLELSVRYVDPRPDRRIGADASTGGYSPDEALTNNQRRALGLTPTYGRRTNMYSRAFRLNRIEVQGMSQTNVGGVTREALRVRLSRGGDRDHWVAQDARLLRIDRSRRLRRGQIRLLRPAEY